MPRQMFLMLCAKYADSTHAHIDVQIERACSGTLLAGPLRHYKASLTHLLSQIRQDKRLQSGELPDEFLHRFVELGGMQVQGDLGVELTHKYAALCPISRQTAMYLVLP